MWYPINQPFSTDKFESPNTGSYSYSNFEAQNNIGGYVSLRNIASGRSVSIPAGEPWPAMIWSGVYDFANLWSVYSGNFLSYAGRPIDQVNGSIALTGLTEIVLTTGINFTQGYLVEAGVKAVRLTGERSGINDAYGMIIQSGNFSDKIFVQTVPYPGFVVNGSFVPSENIDLINKKFRIGRKGSLLQFITSDGYSIVQSGSVATESFFIGTGIAFGCISNLTGGTIGDQYSRIELSDINYKSPIFDVAGDFIEDTLYATNEHTFYTESFKPGQYVSKAGSLVFKLVGYTGGTTRMLAQHKSNGGSFTTYISGSYTTQTGINTLDLSTIPVAGNGTDEFRVGIVQSSLNGTMPPLAVEYATICFEPAANNGLVYLHPEIGSSDGNYSIVVGIDPESRAHVKEFATGQLPYLFQHPLNGTGTWNGSSYSHVSYPSVIQYELTGSRITGTTTGDPLNVPYMVSGYFGYPAKNFRQLNRIPTLLSDLFRSGKTSPPIEGIDYVAVPASEGELLATPDYAIIYPTGTYTGSPTSTIGYALERASVGNKTGISADYWIGQTEFFSDINSGVLKYASQNCIAEHGIGFKTPAIPRLSSATDRYISVSFIGQCSNGGLGITLTGVYAGLYNGISQTSCTVIPSERLMNKQRVSAVFSAPTSSYAVAFISADPVNGTLTGKSISEFSVSDVRIDEFTNDPVKHEGHGLSQLLIFGDDINENYHAFNDSKGFSFDAWIYLDGYTVDGVGYSTIFSFTQNLVGDNISLIIDRMGFPVFGYSLDNSNLVGSYRGSVGISLNRWHHIAAQITPNFEAEIYLDGELIAYSATDIVVPFSQYSSQLTDSETYELGGKLKGAMHSAHLYMGYRTPQEIQTYRAFATSPKFVTQTQIQPNSTVKALYRFDEGTLIDFSSGKNHLITNESYGAKRYTERNVEGVVGEAVCFANGYGRAVSKKNLEFAGDLMTVNGYCAAYADSASDPTIYEWNDSKLSLYSGTYLKYAFGNRTFTGSYPFADTFSFKRFTITHHKSSAIPGVYITGYVWTGAEDLPRVDFTGAVGSIDLALTGIIKFGHDASVVSDYGDIYLDEFAIISGSITGKQYLDHTSFKSQPNEYILINNNIYNSGSLTGAVNHLSVYEKEVVIPPRTSYTRTGSTLKMSVSGQSFGNLLINPAFTYVGARYIVPDTKTKDRLDEISDKICKTKSPFRIGSTVPEDGVNLSYITSPSLSIEGNLALIDNADQYGSNLVNPLNQYFVTDPLTGAIVDGYNFRFTGQLNTDDVLITNYVMNRPEDSTVKAPLFYYARIGDGRYYLKQNSSRNGVGADDISLIRKSIKLYDSDGRQVSIDEFPWDIRASKQREDNATLPHGVYNVDLLTRDAYIPGKTLFIEYDAVDSINSFEQVIGYKEVVNTIPIFDNINYGTPETFSTTYKLELQNLTSGNISIGPELSIYLPTGGWHPSFDKRQIKG